MVGKAGTMLLCLGNLPPRVTKRELKQFVQDVIDGLDSRGLRLGSSIGECSILRLTDPISGDVSYRGLIGIQPPRLALRVIDALKETPMRGVRLQVQRYRHVSFQQPADDQATISDLLGTPAGTLEQALPTQRIDLVASTGPVDKAGVPVSTETRAFAH